VAALEAEFRELFPSYLETLGQNATGHGSINGWEVASHCGGTKIEFPRIACADGEYCFWWPPTLERDFAPDILQTDIAERWFERDVARIVCKSDGNEQIPYALGDKNNDTTCAQAQFTFRGLSAKGSEITEPGTEVLGGDCLSVDVVLRLDGEVLDRPYFVVTQHYIARAGEYHIALRQRTILRGQFDRRVDRSNGRRSRLKVPRLTYKTRYLRDALEAALAKSYHPEDRATSYFSAERRKRRTR
jgi:hypothetical protein